MTLFKSVKELSVIIFNFCSNALTSLILLYLPNRVLFSIVLYKTFSNIRHDWGIKWILF